MNNKKPQNPVVVHKHKILKKIPHVSEMQYLTRVKKTSLNQRIKKKLILPTHHPQSFFLLLLHTSRQEQYDNTQKGGQKKTVTHRENCKYSIKRRKKKSRTISFPETKK